MKIIKTKDYLKKESQYSLPGDPNLPTGVTEEMIGDRFGEPDSTSYSKQSGEYEFKIDWAKETTELINAGYDIRGLPQNGIGDIVVYYEYDADVQGENIQINNLRMLDIKTLLNGRYQPLTVSEPNTKQGIFEGLEDNIAQQEKNVIREQHIGKQSIEPDTREDSF